jgi:hypothetical protein
MSKIYPPMEAGYNDSTETLPVVKGGKKGTSEGHKYKDLFLQVGA